MIANTIRQKLVNRYITPKHYYTIMKIFGLPGTSFSPRRAIGVDVLKRTVAKKTGVPLTKSGAERKIGRTIIKAVGKLFEK